MKHYIIVKFNENVEKEKLINPIKELFQKAMNIKEIVKVDIYESSMDLPNRYDLMIKMDLSKAALSKMKITNLEYENAYKEAKDLMNRVKGRRDKLKEFTNKYLKIMMEDE